jgi:5-methylthioribose kinase
MNGLTDATWLRPSPLFLHAARQAALNTQFANTDIVAANERVVLLSPFSRADSTNRWSSAELDADVQDMW